MSQFVSQNSKVIHKEKLFRGSKLLSCRAINAKASKTSSVRLWHKYLINTEGRRVRHFGFYEEDLMFPVKYATKLQKTIIDNDRETSDEELKAATRKVIDNFMKACHVESRCRPRNIEICQNKRNVEKK